VTRDGARRCDRCGSGELREAKETLSVVLARSAVTASARVTAWRCRSCDGAQVDEAVKVRFHLAVSCELANAGVHTGEAFRVMRNALRLRAVDLARLLDVTPDTISHWETGKARPTRAAFVAIGALVQDAMDGRTTTRDRLAALTSGRAHPRTLSVKVT
jgi:DNA-binding transcriptional regulator YiaG